LAERRPGLRYRRFVARNFRGIYYTDEENAFIDTAAQNIRRIRNRFHRALAYHALFQACLAKRPFNLFHRRNLYLRQAKVERSFGNKATWDRGFPDHLLRQVRAANAAIIEGPPCRVRCGDAATAPAGADLVYLDPPYLPRRGSGVDYLGFYHFLEGLSRYDAWPRLIDRASRHRAFRRQPSPWTDRRRVREAFCRLFDRHRSSRYIVVSYRADGVPSPEEIAEDLAARGRRVSVARAAGYRYVLSRGAGSGEVLVVGEASTRGRRAPRCWTP
jgi:hypothetical protein